MTIERRGLRRGVLILPSLFTLGNLFCGFCAVREAAFGLSHGAGSLEWAAIFILVAMILDGLDGRIARMAHATSSLGMQLDSLADVVSFGVAPGFLVYTWALSDLGRLGWAVAFIFTSCGALRLARFNVLATTKGDARYFVGLPIPAAASAVACSVFLWPSPELEPWLMMVIASWTVALALLMVSTIRYRTFKHGDVRRRRPSRMLLWVLLVFAAIVAHPQLAVACAVLLYTLSGPAVRIFELIKRRPLATEAEASPPPPEV